MPVSRPKAGWLGRRWLGLRRRIGFTPGPSHDRLKTLAEVRDPALFSLLDFAKFSEYVCDRFLADKSNVGQRYALRVLLTYLFPPETNTGVGYRERVLHWFRRRPDDGYFASRLGVDEALDRRFAQFDAVKLLVHLFSPAVSRELATEKHPCAARVFLVAFDQVEGRNELFSADSDWMDFFAQLSELYHTLPNVVVVFTMTLGLRGRLQPMMERQFLDRIRMDDNFVLRFATRDQILSLYQARIRHWIRDNDELRQQYQNVRNLYLPLSQTSAMEAAGLHSLRDVLENLDRAFRRELSTGVSIEPQLDFLVAYNEEFRQYRQARDNSSDTLTYDLEYTENHLQTVETLLTGIRDAGIAIHGLRLVSIEQNETLNPVVLRIQLQDAAEAGVPLIYHLVSLRFMFRNPVLQAITNTIKGKERLRQFLWAVRPSPFVVDIPEPYPMRVKCLDYKAEIEGRLRAILLIVQNRAAYETRSEWLTATELIRRELGATYVGELFTDARNRLDSFQSKLAPALSVVELDEPDLPTTSVD